MKSRFPPLGLLLAMVAATAGAQTPEPAAPATASSRLPEPKRADKAGKSGKAVIPDPDLLDGSTFEKEKRPLHGMLSEIEMGEEEGGKNSQISPNSGPAGNSSSPEDKAAAAKSGGAASAAAAQASQGGADAQVPEGPAAAAEGSQVANLKVPEGAAAGASGADGPKPRDLQIGDASLQIQTVPKNSANVVGAQSSSSQQYDKKTPGGGSSPATGSGGGVEKGRVVPKGL